MKLILPDKVYDILVVIAQYIIPPLGTLYGALCQIWGFPYGEQILATLLAVDTFLCALLGISNKNWKASKVLPDPEVPSEQGVE